MSVKFFGQFLLEKGKIIRQELLEALEVQRQSNVKIGNLAVDAGFLTSEQLEEIQLQQQQTDKMFGEIAVSSGHLTQQQLEELLAIQKSEHVTLGEVLVKKGYLTLSELKQELESYQNSQEGVLEEAYLAVKGSVAPVIPETFLDFTIKFFRRIEDMDVQVVESHNNAGRVAPYLWNIYQCFFGDSNGIYILSIPEEILLKTASQMAQEKIWEIDALAKDGIQEFVNVVVGNCAAKLSQMDIKISIKPSKAVTSLGRIEIPPGTTDAVAVKLSSLTCELQNKSLQMSVLYTPHRGASK